MIDLERRYFNRVLCISDLEFGARYLSTSDLKTIVEDKENYLCKLAITERGHIVGFAICNIISPDSITDKLKLCGEQIPSVLSKSNKIGVIKTIAIAREYQYKGIGTKLVIDCIDDLSKKNVQSLCSIAWKNGNNINIGRILEYLDFFKHAEIKNFWYEESIENKFNCYFCGKPPCECSAVIYAKGI